MPSEPLLTYLMPTYASASYAAVFLLPPDKFPSSLLGSSTFGAAWAAYNIYRSKSVDLGLVTMGIVAAASAMELGLFGMNNAGLTPAIKTVETVGCALVAMNFVLPLLAWSQLTAALGRKKTALWFQIFFYYCVSMAMFWAICAFKNSGRPATGSKLETE